MPTLNSTYAKHLKAVDNSMDGFADIMSSIMDDVLKKIDGYSKQFLKAGELMTSEVLEAAQLNKIRQDILAMLQESGFDDAVDLYVNNWDELSIDGLSDVFKTADIPLSFLGTDLDMMTQLQSFNINKALSIQTAVAENLQTSIANMALGSASWSDTMPELKKRVDIDVHKHLKAQLNTGLSVFDQTINNQVMDEAGVEHFEYYGPPPERSFCKHVFSVQSRSDFDGWTKSEIEALKNRSDWKQSAGGLSSPFTSRGGWNCRHSWGVYFADDIIDEEVSEEIKPPPKKAKPVAKVPKAKKVEPKREAVSNEKDAKKAMTKYKKELDFSDLKPVMDYTEIRYEDINKALLKGGKIPTDIQDDIFSINKFIDDSPRWDGQVTRGMSFDTQKDANNFLKQFKDNDIINNKSFWSTSSDANISDAFLVERDIGIKLEIKSKAGTWLNGVSQNAWEKEVLFKPNSNFKVIKKFKEGDITVIKLLEL